MVAPSGHGWMGGRNGTTRVSSYYSQISAQAEVVDVENTYRPAALNPSNGSFNFADIGTDLDYLAAQGGTKKLIINIPHKKFVAIANAASWVPSWWGARDTAWSAASNGSAVLMRLDNPTIRGYLIALFAGLSDFLDTHAHGNLVSIVRVGSESALSNPFDVNGNPISIGASTWQASLEAFMSGVRAANAYPLMAYTNGFSIVSQTGYIETLLGYGIDAIGNSDSEPFKSGDLGNHNRCVTMAQYATDAILMHNVEDGNYNITCAPPADYVNPTYAGATLTKTTAGSAMMKFIIDAHVNYYKTAKLCWLNSQYGTSGSDSATVGTNVKTAMTAYGSSGLNTFPVTLSEEPPVDPPVSVTGFTFKPIQATLPTAGTPPVAFAVPHSLPASPKLIFNYGNKATANESNTASGALFFGASDFNSQWAVALRSNAANPTATNMRGMTDKCAAMMLSGSTSMDVEVDDGTPDATNINFSITDLPASAYLQELFAACGDGLLRCVTTANLSTQDTAVAVTATDPTTGQTFQPNAAIVVPINTLFNDTAATHVQTSFGIACVNRSATLVQKCLMIKDESGISPSEPVLKLHTTRGGGIISTADAEAFTVQVAFTSTGATVTAKGGNGTGAAVGLVLMQIAGGQDLIDITFPTTTGDHSFNVGGPLDFGMIVGTGLDAVDTIDTTNPGSFFISSFTPTAAALAANTYEDAQTTADNRARAALKPIYLYSQDGTAELLKATYANQTDPNVTFNFATAPATAYKGFLWVVAASGQLAGTSTTVTVPTVLDLSSYTDYVRLGIGSATAVERKADGGGQIQITWNNAPAGVFTGGSANYPQFSATNSAPSGALAASAARPYWGTVGDIVTITAPAGTETATLDAWISASGVDIDITVSISDGSADDYETTLTSADTTSGAISRKRIEADYVALLNGETITLTAEITAVNATGGNMTVPAAALTNDYVPPADILPPALVFGYPQLVSMTETSPGSNLYDVSFDLQLSEAGTIFGQLRAAANMEDPSSPQVEQGTDGAGSSTDIFGSKPSSDIDFLEVVRLTFQSVPGGTSYWADFGAKDNAPTPNYMVGAYTTLVVTPSPEVGGGSGSYTGTTGVMVNNTNTPKADGTTVMYAIYKDGDTNSPHYQLPDRGPLPAATSGGRITTSFDHPGTHWLRATDEDGNECYSGPVVFA